MAIVPITDTTQKMTPTAAAKYMVGQVARYLENPDYWGNLIYDDKLTAGERAKLEAALAKVVGRVRKMTGQQLSYCLLV